MVLEYSPPPLTCGIKPQLSPIALTKPLPQEEDFSYSPKPLRQGEGYRNGSKLFSLLQSYKCHQIVLKIESLQISLQFGTLPLEPMPILPHRCAHLGILQISKSRRYKEYSLLSVLICAKIGRRRRWRKRIFSYQRAAASRCGKLQCDSCKNLADRIGLPGFEDYSSSSRTRSDRGDRE